MSIEESQEKGIFGKEVGGRQLVGADALFAAAAAVAAEAATERNQAVSTWMYTKRGNSRMNLAGRSLTHPLVRHHHASAVPFLRQGTEVVFLSSQVCGVIA